MDRIFLRLTGEPTRGRTIVAMATAFGLGAEILTPTGLFSAVLMLLFEHSVIQKPATTIHSVSQVGL